LNEDLLICVENREFLINEKSISFAPRDVAENFSYKSSGPQNITLGFHGLFNFWRHIDDFELLQIANHLTYKHFRLREFIELTAQYYLLEKFKIFIELRK
jgi:hypothetical protein